jgi:hypothetical protein
MSGSRSGLVLVVAVVLTGCQGGDTTGRNRTGTVTHAMDPNASGAETPTAVPTMTATTTVAATVTATASPRPAVAFSEGTYLIGRQIQPGIYRTNGKPDRSNTAGCRWQRLADLSGRPGSILAGGLVKAPVITTINRADFAFKVTGDCLWFQD